MNWNGCVQDYLSHWEFARALMQDFSGHYSVQPWQARDIFDAAITLPFDSTIVELGVCNGRTAAMLAYCASQSTGQYYGIDHFGLENTASSAREKFSTHGLDLHGTIIEGNTHIVGHMWDKPIDLLFIDAGHDEANVGPDVTLWVPLLKPGGILFMHDYDDPYDPSSAHEAVRRHGDAATEGWERSICDGMLRAVKPR